MPAIPQVNESDAAAPPNCPEPQTAPALESPSTGGQTPGRAMLTPAAAWRTLSQRIGAPVSLSTFYRWIESGNVISIRLGFRIYIPAPALESIIERCLRGERPLTHR